MAVTKHLITASLLLGSCNLIADDKFSIQYLSYQEDENRISVSAPSFMIEKDFGTDYTLKVDYTYDSISGSTPILVRNDTVSSASANTAYRQGLGDFFKPSKWIDVISDTFSSASAQSVEGEWTSDSDNFEVINYDMGEDARHAFSTQFIIRMQDRSELTLGAATSSEKDFSSQEYSFEYMFYTDKYQNSNMKIGISSQSNELSGTNVANGFSDEEKPRGGSNSVTNLEIGFGEIISKKTLFETDLFVLLEDGYLSNPYLNILREVGTTHIQFDEDARPDSKTAAGVNLKLISEFGTTADLHLGYRLYTDSWDVNSHTYDIKLYKEWNEKLIFIPSIRLYSQTAANFYKDPSNIDDRIFKSSEFGTYDYRLGEFDATTYSLGIERKINDKTTFNINGSWYDQTSGLKAFWITTGVVFNY